MLSSREIDAVVDATRSELKRWGGDEPSLAHLAAVLERKWPTEFESVFGDEGIEEVESLLRHGRFPGREADIRALLGAKASQRSGVLSALKARLAPEFEAARPGVEPDAVPAAAEPDAAGQATPDPAEFPAPSAWPVRSATFVQMVEPRSDLLERRVQIEELAVAVTRQRRQIAAIVGEPGCGRLALVAGVMDLLSNAEAALPVVRVGPDTLGSSGSSGLRRVLEDVEQPVILVIDDFEILARLGSASPDGEFLELLRAAIYHPLARLVLIVNKRYVSRFEIHAADLAERVVRVIVPSLSGSGTRIVLATVAAKIGQRYGVEIGPALIETACAPARSADTLAHPGLAIDRLDEAAARCALRGATIMEHEDFDTPVATADGTPPAGELAARLAERIKGQDEAIRVVSERLALTRARLDLRPERPDGVFLFVGPTGVGKTELAREIGTRLFGGSDRVIRLDMSEYSHDWAVSRLVGPMPGYVGSTEPETWLTTRIASMPQCVLLLDEIEKAHPTVWNTFLQVFDVGRLTDSRGVTADFGSVVIVLTSNLGVADAGTQPLGFGPGGDMTSRQTSRLLVAVRDQMPPELLNRIDEIVPFGTLSQQAIAEIAQRELEAALERLSEIGWQIECSPGVAEYLAKTGYDPAYGARHLQRNLERLFLVPLSRQASRRVRVTCDGDSLEVAGA